MFGEINAIRELATKYSKPQLANLAQTGQIEPQKAVLAGMMIDRIAKSAMQPPQTTVAQDVLSPQPAQMPPMAQGQPPQMPPQMPRPAMAANGGLMGMMPYSDGVAALHSGLHDMAGGGIVAFADGGDVPGYAEGTLTSSRADPAMRINPLVQSRRDQTRYQILADELKDAQRRMLRGDPSAEADFKAIQREMRSVKPAPTADAGIGALIPSAQAATPTAAKAPTSTAPSAEEEAVYDIETGVQISGPSRAKESSMATMSPAEIAAKVVDPNYKPYRASTKATTPATTAAPAAAKPPVKMDVPPVETPTTTEAPEENIKPPAEIQASQIKVPSETDFGKEYGDTQSAYKQAGVDVDMYKNMMSELDTKKAGFAKKKEQALGAAMLAFGLDLAGARQGQVFQQMSSGGQKALGMYMNSMDKIADNEDKLDNLKSQLRMAENNFKRTGADSALTQVRARKDRIEQIETKNVEMKQRAAEHQATVAASVYHTDIASKTQRDVAGAQAATRMAVAQATAGRAGMLTDKQKFDIKQQIQTTLEPKFREQYKNNPNAERIIQQKLNDAFLKEIGNLRSTPSGYGGAVPEKDMFAEWSVEGM